jgi:hypothetical protein
MVQIHAKWGFGNAPLKRSHKEKTEAAMLALLIILDELPQNPELEHLEAISHVKGQFTRTVKQDQWDWNTVWFLLGRPSRRFANKISIKLGQLRSALKNQDRQLAEQIQSELKETKLVIYLDNFLVGGRDKDRQEGLTGYIYILSTRAQPKILKIGMTQRSVDVRVKEINAATGVIIPFGVRAIWKVDNAFEVEKEIHALLAEYRVRRDREFFELEFNKVSQLINDYLGSRRILKHMMNP